jgi:hypothetical protein
MAAVAATGREYVDVDDGDRKSPGTSADELDREQIEQLHAATLKASDSCFELKKLCATVLVPTATVVAVFTDKRLNEAVFIAGLATRCAARAHAVTNPYTAGVLLITRYVRASGLAGTSTLLSDHAQARKWSTGG